MISTYGVLHPTGRAGKAEGKGALACCLLWDRAYFMTGSCHLIGSAYAAQ